MKGCVSNRGRSLEQLQAGTAARESVLFEALLHRPGCAWQEVSFSAAGHGALFPSSAAPIFAEGLLGGVGADFHVVYRPNARGEAV